jgi:UDP-glucose 4-epimerase
MRALVTGGAGFIGRHLVAALTARGDAVDVLDSVHGNDLTVMSSRALREFVRRADVVYHLAALSSVMDAETAAGRDRCFSTNVLGTFRLLEACSWVGSRVVFTSSREVYGDASALPVSEDAPLKPKNSYGASKVAAEAYCRIYGARILRLANVYGPGDTGRVIPNWLSAAALGHDFPVYGGEQVLDFVPVRTVVQALLSAADLAELREPVNVGSGKGTSLETLAARIIRGSGERVTGLRYSARDAETVRFVADVTRMRTVLGVAPPRHPLVGLAELQRMAQGVRA